MWVRGNKPELAPTKVPTVIDIAWSAGIYEGEGCCRLCGKTKRGFMIQIAQKDPELLYRLRNWFGGSIRGNGGPYGVHSWDVCGDYARIFIALIYEFMTARRKTQIDASGALLYLGDKSPSGLSITQLKEILRGYYAENTRQQIKHNLEQRKEKYKETYADPEERKKILERNRLAREAMTPEQIEASRKYQQGYYQRKKMQQKLKDVPIKDTA